MTRERLRALHTAGVITEREHEILDYRARGISQWTIAIALHISPSTVKSTERNAHRKIANHSDQEDAA